MNEDIKKLLFISKDKKVKIKHLSDLNKLNVLSNTRYTNIACINCSNNPINNPYSSGVCNCNLGDMRVT